MKHGGDLVSYQHLYHGELVDFSSNINPAGYPPILDEVLPQGLQQLRAYPDVYYRALRQAIGTYVGCEPEQVLVGNGSMEILDYFCRNARRVVVCIPCFLEYTERARIASIPVVTLPLAPDFRVTAAMFENTVHAGDVVILGNPNNPTGQRIARDELCQLQRLTEERGAFLVLDEVFFEFSPADYDSIRLFDGKPNVCVVRAATKFFGLPGLRLGYACAAPEVARRYDAWALPWRINALADLAGQVIFQQTEFIQASQAYMAQERAFMLTQLHVMDGLTAYPTDANFVLLKLRDTTEEVIFERLLRQGLLIRKGSTFEGLDATYIRIAIKDHANNLRLLAALRAALLESQRDADNDQIDFGTKGSHALIDAA